MRRRGGVNKGGAISIALIVVAFLVIMGIQIYHLKLRDDAYAAQEAGLQQEYEDETQRSKDLDELEAHMKSPEYIKEEANKQGLVTDNQLLFKEEGN